MVGVIHDNGSTSITTQIKLAKESDYMLLPGESFPSEAESSVAALASTATATVTEDAATQTSSAVGVGMKVSSYCWNSVLAEQLLDL